MVIDSLECCLAVWVVCGDGFVQVGEHVVDSSVEFLEIGFEFGLEVVTVTVAGESTQVRDVVEHSL